MNLSRYTCFLYKGPVYEAAAQDDELSGERTGLGDTIPEHDQYVGGGSNAGGSRGSAGEVENLIWPSRGGDGITEGNSNVVPMDVVNIDENRSKKSFPC